MGGLDPVGEVPVDWRAEQCGFQLGQALGHRRAGADCYARRCDFSVGDFQDRCRHGDGDHEVAPRAELQEGAARLVTGARHMDGDGDFTWREGGAARAGDELPERQETPAGRTGDLDLGVEGEQTGHAVGRRRGVAEIAGERAGILDLPAADFTGGLLQAIEQGRQVGLYELAPGRGGAQPPARIVDCDAAQGGDAADVEHVLVDRPADPRRIESVPPASTVCGRTSAVSASSRRRGRR